VSVAAVGWDVGCGERSEVWGWEICEEKERDRGQRRKREGEVWPVGLVGLEFDYDHPKPRNAIGTYVPLT
jgi:hypothetical protein